MGEKLSSPAGRPAGAGCCANAKEVPQRHRAGRSQLVFIVAGVIGFEAITTRRSVRDKETISTRLVARSLPLTRRVVTLPVMNGTHGQAVPSAEASDILGRLPGSRAARSTTVRDTALHLTHTSSPSTSANATTRSRANEGDTSRVDSGL